MQDIKVIDEKLNKLLGYTHEGLPLRSLSGLYKALRSDGRVSMVGDYSLLSYILRKTAEKFPSFKWSRHQIYHALTFCKFWEEEGRKKKYTPREWQKYVK